MIDQFTHIIENKMRRICKTFYITLSYIGRKKQWKSLWCQRVYLYDLVLNSELSKIHCIRLFYLFYFVQYDFITWTCDLQVVVVWLKVTDWSCEISRLQKQGKAAYNRFAVGPTILGSHHSKEFYSIGLPFIYGDLSFKGAIFFWYN